MCKHRPQSEKNAEKNRLAALEKAREGLRGEIKVIKDKLPFTTIEKVRGDATGNTRVGTEENRTLTSRGNADTMGDARCRSTRKSNA